MLRIFTNSLFAYYLYTRAFTCIFVMLDYFVFLFAQVTWHHVRHPIHALKDDRQSSLKAGVRGAFIFINE